MSNVSIEVYGADWCENCTPFKNELDSLGVTYTYKDAEGEGITKEMFNLGIRSIPAVVIKRDDEIIYKGTGNQALDKIKELS